MTSRPFLFQAFSIFAYTWAASVVVAASIVGAVLGSVIYGAFIGVFYGSAVAIVVSILSFVATRYTARISIDQARAISAVLGAISVAVIIVDGFAPPDSVLFRRHVIDPIPESVSYIRAHTERSGPDADYIFRFASSASDRDRIVAKWHLERIGSVTPESGIAGQQPGNIGWRLFHAVPEWWRPSQLSDPVVYERIVDDNFNVYLIHGTPEEDVYFVSQHW